MNTLRSAQDATLKRYKSELTKLGKEKGNIVQAIKDGIPAIMVKDDLTNLTARQEELEELLENHTDEPKPLLHPSMETRYKQEVHTLRRSLNDDQHRGEAAEHLRKLVETIVLTPRPGEDDLSIDLYGDLAGILTMANEETSMKKEEAFTKRLKTMVANDNSNPSIELVAGAGFGHYLQIKVISRE